MIKTGCCIANILVVIFEQYSTIKSNSITFTIFVLLRGAIGQYVIIYMIEQSDIIVTLYSGIVIEYRATMMKRINDVAS